MKSSDNDETENKRVEALNKFRILDTPPEESFDDIVKMASLICETPISLISLVDVDRQWFKARIGFEQSETPRDIAFCNHAIRQDQLMIVPDALLDNRFAESPLVTENSDIRFYAGMPITTRDGFKLGALCVIDSKPRKLTDKQIFVLKTLAKQVMRQLELRLNNETIEEQKVCLLHANQELQLLNENLQSSSEEIRSNLEKISSLQSKLVTNERQYRSLVEDAIDLIYELDEHGKFTFVNGVMERETEYEKDKLLSKVYWDLVHPSHRDYVIQFYEAQRKAKIENTYLEFIMLTRTGKACWIGQNVRMFFKDDGFVYKVTAISRDIDALKKTEQKLEDSEKKFRLLSENSPVGIFQTDADGKCTYVNKRWCEITGVAPEALLGTGWLNVLDTGHRYTFVSQWKESLIETGKFVKDIQITTEGGGTRWVTSRVNQITADGGLIEGYIVTTDDITELKEAHHKLVERTKLYRLLSTNSKDLITLCKADENATRIFVSPSAKDILGYDPYELTNKSSFNFILDEDLERVREITRSVILNGKPATIEFRMRRKDGTIIWMESNSNPYFDEVENMVGFQTSARDVTKRKEFEQSLREAKEKAEEATMAKSKFLSMMSHEIRTPMNAIIGFTNLLLNSEPRADQKESLEILKFSGENLLTIINDILDFSKIESDKIELESIDFDLHKLVMNIKNMLEQRMTQKGVDLIFNYHQNLPRIVKGDSVRIAQVITNLAANAIKFTEAGTVQVSVTSKGILGNMHQVHFAVKDTGIGIESHKIESIFERFAQADSDTTRKFGGTGLGLSITKSLLNLMNSEIHVESEVGKGSTFSFELLLEEGCARLPKVSSVEKHDHENFSTNGITVLLVEDNRVNQIVASKFLRGWGIRVETANNGREALEMIQQKSYDLVLMDVQMPVMDGYEAVSCIRSLNKPYFKEVPIIALTASAMHGMREKVLEVGMTDFISKPFVPGDLHAKIKKYVSRAQLKPNRFIHSPFSIDIQSYKAS